MASSAADSSGVDATIRDRATRLFDYLKAVRAVKEPPIRDIAAHRDRSWFQGDLPAVPELKVGDTVNGTWLTIKKPALPPGPRVPADLASLMVGPTGQPSEAPSLRADIDELFTEEPWEAERARTAFQAWLEHTWKSWAADAKEIYRARRLFDDLYEARLRLDREEAETELVWGHGLLVWRRGTELVRYPVITTACAIVFDPETGNIQVVPDGVPKLEIDTLQNLVGAFDLLVDARKVFREAPSDPWVIEDARGTYERFLNSIGEHSEIEPGPNVPTADETPRLVLTSALFLRRRATMFAKFFEDFGESLANGEPVPAPIATIVADEPSTVVSELGLNHDVAGWERTATRILMPLPANEQQQAIAHRLGSYTGVVVQGPPGTGKTHTIANLVAHLVAQGKRVLVTAQKEQPLRVLRDKVPEDIRELCVAVLGASTSTLGQLNQSLQTISEKGSTLDTAKEQRRVKALEKEIDKIIEEIAALRARQMRVAKGESRTFVLRGADVPSPDLAKWLATNEAALGCIPDAISPDVACPLAPEQLKRLLELEGSHEPADRVAAVESLPDPTSIPSGDVLVKTFTDLDEVRARLSEVEFAFADWEAIDLAGGELVADLVTEVRRAIDGCARFDVPWLRAVADSVVGEAGRAEWASVVQNARAQITAIEQFRLRLNRYRLDLPGSDVPTRALLDQLTELRNLLPPTGKGLPRFGQKELKALHAVCLLDGESARSSDEVDVLIEFATMKRQRAELVTWWNATALPAEAPPLQGQTAFPERELGQSIDLIEGVIRWETVEWPNVRARLRALSAQAPERPTQGSLQLLVELLTVALERLEERRLAGELETLSADLDAGAKRAAASPLWRELRNSLQARQVEKWDVALTEAARLRRLVPRVAELNELSCLLVTQAPLWAAQIREARGALSIGPGSLADYWLWRQAETWLQAIIAEDNLVTIGKKLEDRRLALGKKTEELCAVSAWLAVAENLTDQTRQSMIAWAQALGKVGKGKGKYAGKWRAEANKAMHDAVEAVPVWIMPMYRVVESFSPDQAPFDVVIIDESSQCDVFSFAALALARKVVVVGDDKQISPQAVGTNLEEVGRLIAQHIPDIPYSQLLDPQSSLYDLAKRTFPGVIVLREHFRCMPEIIQFSNDLCYEGKILPLREDIPSSIGFPVLDRIVEGGFFDRGRKLNPPEAEAIVATIQELVADSAYNGKTMGVISLLGSDQARMIEELLIARLGEKVIEERQLRCGDAYHFQGDERDIMFISLVVSRTDAMGDDIRPGAFVREPDQQRLNVAASRARDQLWLFRSLGADDLSNGDLRARFIRYCADPKRAERAFEELEDKCGSQFEKDVLRKILAREYSVDAQHRVGNFRIDFVVKGLRRQLAVECDGDAWHGPDKWEDDRRRQEILERLDWRFFRVRGSEFYRDPERALAPLWERLDDLGINAGTVTATEAATAVAEGRPQSLVIRTPITPSAEASDADDQHDDDTGARPEDAASDCTDSETPATFLAPELSPTRISTDGSPANTSPGSPHPARPPEKDLANDATHRAALDVESWLLRLPDGDGAESSGSPSSDEAPARETRVEEVDEFSDHTIEPVVSDSDLGSDENEVLSTPKLDAPALLRKPRDNRDASAPRVTPQATRSTDTAKVPRSVTKLDPDGYRGKGFRNVPIGLLAYQIALVVQGNRRVAVDALSTLYEQRFGVRVDDSDDRLFKKFIWSAIGHHWIAWDDPEKQDVLIRGTRSPEPLDPPGSWTLDQVWDLAARLHAERPRADEQEHFDAVMGTVYPTQRRQPTLMRSIVGKAVYAARNARL